MVGKRLRRPVPQDGMADPDLPSEVLVPLRSADRHFPQVNYSVPDSSYWRVSRKTGRADSIITVTPDGVKIGWDSCGTCARSLHVCDCASGISLPNSVGYIFVTRGGIRPVKPVPLPLAPTFQAPGVPTHRGGEKKRLRRPEAPKKLLKRPAMDAMAEQEAIKAVERVLKRLKR